MNLDQLPVSHAPLQPVSEQIPDVSSPSAVLQELAAYLSSPTNPRGIPQKNPLSTPMQRKLITLINCQLDEEEGRIYAMKAARYIGERSLKDLILHHQNPHQLSADFFIAVRARGCQFLGPALQDEALKLVLLALEDGSGLSRKVLVMFVLQRLVPQFPHASKTSIGNIVQLLYRSSCFKISKREGDSSLLVLKEEFRTYDALRRKHDSEMVQIATEAGLYISPEQWSSILYGDSVHSSYMQSIIAKLQTPQSFSQSIDELVIALQRNGDPGNLFALKPHLELLADIDPDPPPPSWKDLNLALEAAKFVLKGLLEFIQQFGKNLDSNSPCHAFDRLSISESWPSASPVIDSSANSHFSNVQVSSASLSDFSSPLDSLSPLQTVHTLNPESPVFSPLAKLPRAILKQSSRQTLSSTNSLCQQNIGSSLSIVGSIPAVTTELQAAKLQPSNNCHAQQSARNSPYFSNESFSSFIDPYLQNAVMPTVHCQDSFSLKSGLENHHLDSNQNLAALLQRKKQLRAQMNKVKHFNGGLSGPENNVIATNMETPFCFFKATEDDNVSFHSPCTSKRKITGRHGRSSMSHDDNSFSLLDPPYNEFDSMRSKLDSEIQYSTPTLFFPSDKDEFIPFEPMLVSKYGHISRCSESSLCGPAAIHLNTASEMGELTTTTSVVQRSSPSVCLASPFCTAVSPSSAVPTAAISEQYAPVVESATALMSVECPPERN